jgi:hypothetical protein
MSFNQCQSKPDFSLTVIELHVHIVTFNKAVPFHNVLNSFVYWLLLLDDGSQTPA